MRHLSAKYLFLLLLVVPGVAWPTGMPFTIASESLAPPSEGAETTSVLNRLKQQAVREYLQRILGPRYERYDSSVTSDFAERYILDYQVNRQSTDSTQMEISGRLDVDALKQWVRVNETKATGSNILKPLFLLSASLPGYSIDPRQTGSQVSQNPVAQGVLKALNDGFAKFNAVLTTASADATLGLTHPPAREAEIRTLKNYGLAAGSNSVVWVHFSACMQCGTRVDISLYNLTQARKVHSSSTDIDYAMSDLGDPKKLNKALGKLFKDFAAAFEESVSSGILFATEYKVVVERVDAYKTYKLIDAALAKQDFVLQSTLSRAQNGTAEFKILSPLQPRELYQRFSVAQFPGLTLKPVSIDSQTITVRYLN